MSLDGHARACNARLVAWQLPVRYQETQALSELLVGRVAEFLTEGMQVLDVGAGRTPTLPQRLRQICTYVALDQSEVELGLAAASYDEIVVSDVLVSVPALFERFDLIISCHAFEHMADVPLALRRLRAYVKENGALLALTAGRFSAHALANQILPRGVGSQLVGRPSHSVFPARYHRCWYAALLESLVPWNEVTVTPIYLGANYFGFSQRLQRAFIRYENWAASHPNLASHYLIDARA